MALTLTLTAICLTRFSWVFLWRSFRKGLSFCLVIFGPSLFFFFFFLPIVHNPLSGIIQDDKKKKKTSEYSNRKTEHHNDLNSKIRTSDLLNTKWVLTTTLTIVRTKLHVVVNLQEQGSFLLYFTDTAHRSLSKWKCKIFKYISTVGSWAGPWLGLFFIRMYSELLSTVESTYCLCLGHLRYLSCRT